MVLYLQVQKEVVYVEVLYLDVLKFFFFFFFFIRKQQQ